MRKILVLAFAALAAELHGAMPVSHREATNIAERAVASAVMSTPIPPAKTNLATYVNRKAHPVTGVAKDEDEDGSVVIGKNASGTISPSFIDSITAPTQLRSEAIAIGHNATVTNDANGTRRQGIAIGWNAKAVGSNALAIGSGAKHWYESDEGGDRTYARGSEATALGYCARATADRAVQIGNGINTTPGSLKFRDVYIVRGGRLDGALSTNDVIAMAEDYLRPRVETGEASITARSYSLTVYSPSGWVEDELEVWPTATRNYELFLPDTPELRGALPISVDAAFEGAVKLGAWWTNKVTRLPALVKVREPVPGTCILEIDVFGEEPGKENQ